MTNPESLTAEPSGGPTSLEWLSNRQAEHVQQPDGDPILGYCRQLEARIASQSAEIEALRQMLQSEHGRHARVSARVPAGALSRLRQAWVKLTLLPKSRPESPPQVPPPSSPY